MTTTQGDAVQFPQQARWTGIDAVRGLAAILMVQQHLGVWLTIHFGMTSPLRPLLVALNLTGGAAAPLFILLAGVGVALGEAGQRTTRRELALRGALLLAFGWTLNLLVPSWFTLWSFYVLHLLGAFLLLAAMLRGVASSGLAVAAVVSLVAGLAVQVWLETPLVLQNARMVDSELPGGGWRLALGEGHFPLFPWLAVAFLGWFGGRLLVQGRERRVWAIAAGCALAGLLARAPVLFDPQLARRAPPSHVVRFSFYPATTSFVLVLAGVALGAVAAFVWLQRRDLLPAWLTRLGRTSLSLLFVHIVVFREGAERLELRNMLSVPLALVVIVGLLTAWTQLSRWWLRYQLVGSLEWLLRTLPRVVGFGFKTRGKQAG